MPYGPRSIPSLGSGTGELDVPPPHVEFRNTNCSIATAAARVTTARLTPRTRSADTAMIRPHTVAPTAPISIPAGKPTPWSAARWERMNPEIPASASWTIEIWPTKPVITTTDRHMIVARSDVISACLKSYGKAISATTAAVAPSRTFGQRRFARGASGSRCSTSSPRLGRLVPRTNIAITMSPKTRSGCTPGIATPLSVGNQLWIWK